jgi:hypothetical protein
MALMRRLTGRTAATLSATTATIAHPPRASGSVHRASGALALALALLLSTGCSGLLPQGRSANTAPFASFEAAQAAAAHIVALQTTPADLKVLGFDIDAGANVTRIPYPDIVARLTPHPNVPLPKLDPGIRQCAEDQTACRGFLFRFEQQSRRREGNFLLDFFNVRRSTRVRGWWFEALIVVSGDRVLFHNVGGQALLERVEQQTNPLGPLQPAGEAAGSLLLR